MFSAVTGKPALGYIHTVPDSETERCRNCSGKLRASVHIRNAIFGAISAPEQDYFDPYLKDVILAAQRSTHSCSHCTGLVSAMLRSTFWYSVNIALFLARSKVNASTSPAFSVG